MQGIGIIGLGRVGLTLALVLAEAGFKIWGVEREKEIVESLNSGKPHFYEKGLESLLRKHLHNDNLTITNKIERRLDAYIICVATPVEKATKKIVLESLIHATREAAEWVGQGDTVIVRSTVPIGTTREMVLPILQKNHERFYLAYCPERTIEGKALLELKELPQIVGGVDEESVEKAVAIFSKVTPIVVRVDSLEAAEFIKLIDNSYRDMNFAFANEIALLAREYGIDGFKLIKAANYGYQRNNIPIPGFAGGACLVKDPYILRESALKKGHEIKFPKISRETNEGLIAHVAGRIKETMLSLGKDTETAKILILGIAFKGEPDTDDVRGSPAVDLANCLKANHGFTNIHGHDYVVPPGEIARTGIGPCSLEEGFRNADGVILMNTHRQYYDLDMQLFNLTRKPVLFFDGWHMFGPEKVPQGEGIVYRGLTNA